MAYGYIQTSANVAKQLKELNRDYYGRKTWGSLYGAVDLQRQQALSQLNYDYDSQIAKAYSTAFQQKSAIANSALGSGFKEQGQMNIDMALEEAFNTYRQNYLNSAAQVEETAFAATSQIDAMLEQEAQNYVDYEASTYSYLQNLYDRAYPTDGTESDSNLVKMFEEDPNWSKYIVTNPDGTKRIMNEQELRRRNYDMDTFGEGTLNKTGVDFYDQMLNQLSAEGEGYGFHEWLSKENSELYEWSQSGDAYNYSEAGTKMGSFKKMMGLKSTDDQYTFIERFGGMTPKDVKYNVATFLKDIETITNTGDMNDTVDILKGYSSALGNLEDYVNKLDMTEDDKKVVLSAIDTVRNNIKDSEIQWTGSGFLLIDNTAEAIRRDWKLVEQDWNDYGIGGATMQLGLLVMDAVLTFAASGLTEIGILMGGPVKDEYKALGTARDNANKAAVDKIEQDYLDVITLLASYAK